jgi:hypothetical protein
MSTTLERWRYAAFYSLQAFSNNVALFGLLTILIYSISLRALVDVEIFSNFQHRFLLGFVATIVDKSDILVQTRVILR